MKPMIKCANCRRMVPANPRIKNQNYCNRKYVQRDAHDFMRFSFNENHNVNIPAPQPLSALCGILWHMEYLPGKHTSFST
jgi:hypothetical protein